MVPSVKDNNPFGTQKTVLLDFDVEWAREGPQGNFKISKPIVAAVTCLKYCRYGVKLYLINQSQLFLQKPDSILKIIC